MKKILSLVLVVLMLASLAITASATAFNNPFKPDSNDVKFESLLDYYMWLYLSQGNTKPDIDDATPVWYDQCPRCGNVAMFFESDGRIVWTCLAPDCNKSGFYPVVPETSNTPIVPCPTCKKSGTVVYLSATIKDGKIVHSFFCRECHKLFDKDFNYGTGCPDFTWCGNCHKPNCSVCHNFWFCPVCRPGCGLPEDDEEIDPGFSYPGYPQFPDYTYWPSYISYNCFSCKEKLELQYYTKRNDSYYGIFKCKNNHVYTLPVYGLGETPDFDFDFSDKWPSFWPTVPAGNYRINVICSEGGSYAFSDGIPYGEKGDHKAITFTPAAGYAVENVTLNGKKLGSTTKLFFEIEGTTTIKVTFKKVGNAGSTGNSGVTTPVIPTVPSTEGKFVFNATSNGKGTIEAYKNGAKVESATIFGADKKDTVTLKFVPSSANYYVADVRVDGESIGAVKSYTFKNVNASHTVTVEFKWKSPFTYIAPNYAVAVEYVTEAGIMAPTKVEGKKAYFSGTNVVSIKAFAAALAEMCDVEGKLDTDDERAYWALKNGLLLTTDDETAPCNVQTACRMVNAYLAYIENLNSVNFVDFDASATAKDNALSLGLVTEAGYTGNRNLTRYDLAAVCYMIKTQDYSMK